MDHLTHLRNFHLVQAHKRKQLDARIAEICERATDEPAERGDRPTRDDIAGPRRNVAPRARTAAERQDDRVDRILAQQAERRPFKEARLREYRQIVAAGRQDTAWRAQDQRAENLSDHIEFALDGHIRDEAEAYVRKQLSASPRATTCTVHLNSPGGFAHNGLAIYGLLNGHPAHKTCYVRNKAWSAANMILLACDHRVSDPSACFMIHRADYRAIGIPMEEWTVEMWAVLDAYRDIEREIYINRTGLTGKDYATLWNAGTADGFHSSDAAQYYGLVDEVCDLFPVASKTRDYRASDPHRGTMTRPTPTKPKRRFTAFEHMPQADIEAFARMERDGAAWLGRMPEDRRTAFLADREFRAIGVPSHYPLEVQAALEWAAGVS